MEEFAEKTSGMILKAMGKTRDDYALTTTETEKLVQHHRKIIADIGEIAPKELEAYLTLNKCRSYEELAKFIAKREKKNLSEKEYEVLLGRLRTRAQRGRKKVIRRIRQVFHTEGQDGE